MFPAILSISREILCGLCVLCCKNIRNDTNHAVRGLTTSYGADMHSTRQKLFLLVLLISISQLASCGQKGPLYMPDQEKQNEQQQKS